MTPVYEDVFMLAALKEAAVALHEGEVPVGCVVVRMDSESWIQRSCSSSPACRVVCTSPISSLAAEKRVIARGRNATNQRHHALAHAEFIAMEVLQKEYQTLWHVEVEEKGLENKRGLNEENVLFQPSSVMDHCHSEDSSLPLHQDEVLLLTIPCVLYVTVEPCIMCAAMLRYHQCSSLPSTSGDAIRIKDDGFRCSSSFSESINDRANEGREKALQELDTKKSKKMIRVQRFFSIQHVFYGCGNPRFGGNGSVLSLHDDKWGEVQEKHLCLSSSAIRNKNDEYGKCVSAFPTKNDGIVEPKPYVSEGGHRKEEAIALLQKFYQRENINAPGHKRRRKPTTMKTEMLDSGESEE